MKKRLFISAHYMEIGGAEISLIGLLQAMDYSKYDVDLFLNRHTGELMQFIPKEVNLLPEIKMYADVEKPLIPVLFSSSWKIGFARIWSKFKTWLYCSRHKDVQDSVNIYFGYFERLSSRFLPSLYKYGEYDLAANFIGNADIIRHKVKAKKRIGWIHTDYSSIKVSKHGGGQTGEGLDHIVSISKASTEAYIKVFPEAKEKMVDIENILSPGFVRQRGELEEIILKKESNEIVLLSVGRFCDAKNYDNVPDITSKIITKLSALSPMRTLKWYIIGFGPDEQLIRQKIDEAGMEEHVIILGKKANPYPYIKACDWYVQPSRYEGKSVTVREAQILCKPVIIANYVTAKSQVLDGVDGVIVPQENEACAEAIAEAIVDEQLHDTIKDYLRVHDYGNLTEVEKLYQLI